MSEGPLRTLLERANLENLRSSTTPTSRSCTGLTPRLLGAGCGRGAGFAIHGLTHAARAEVDRRQERIHCR